MSALLVDASELDRLNQRMREYVKASKRTTSYLLDKKGNDLRIALFQEFKANAWTDKAAQRKTIAYREFLARLRSGKGILVRLKQLNPNIRMPEATVMPRNKSGKPRELNWYQKLVAQELFRRTIGIGVLAAGFLAKRYRWKGGQRYVVDVKLKNGQRAVTFTKTDDSFTVDGFTPGMEKVARNHGVLANAMRKVSDDIDKYFADHHADVLTRLINGEAPQEAVEAAKP